MDESSLRYLDTGETVYTQMGEVLVACPRCFSCACVTPRPDVEPNRVSYFTPRRIVCSSCGFVREQAADEGASQARRGLRFDWYADPMRDSWFGLPLWLQTPCCGHTLWAYNRRHLDLIERHIRAKQRQHRPHPNFGWRNSSLVNRLPEWMIVANHRPAVLAAITRLKKPR